MYYIDAELPAQQCAIIVTRDLVHSIYSQTATVRYLVLSPVFTVCRACFTHSDLMFLAVSERHVYSNIDEGDGTTQERIDKPNVACLRFDAPE